MREERRNAYVVGEDPNSVRYKYLSNIPPPSLPFPQVYHAQCRDPVGWLLVPGVGLSVSACDGNRLTTMRDVRIPAHRNDIARPRLSGWINKTHGRGVGWKLEGNHPKWKLHKVDGLAVVSLTTKGLSWHTWVSEGRCPDEGFLLREKADFNLVVSEDSPKVWTCSLMSGLSIKKF